MAPIMPRQSRGKIRILGNYKKGQGITDTKALILSKNVFQGISRHPPPCGGAHGSGSASFSEHGATGRAPPPAGGGQSGRRRAAGAIATQTGSSPSAGKREGRLGDYWQGGTGPCLLPERDRFTFVGVEGRGASAGLLYLPCSAWCWVQFWAPMAGISFPS